MADSRICHCCFIIQAIRQEVCIAAFFTFHSPYCHAMHMKKERYLY